MKLFFRRCLIVASLAMFGLGVVSAALVAAAISPAMIVLAVGFWVLALLLVLFYKVMLKQDTD